MYRFVITALLMILAIPAWSDDSRWIEVRGGVWHPAMSTLTELEAVLRPAIETASHNRGRLPPWHEYTFQYQGRASLLGQQYVYVNGFCSYSQGDLRTQWVEVFDGGACFF